MTPGDVNFWQMFFTGIAALAAIIATGLAYQIGKKYISEGFGKYENGGWNIHQAKRVEVGKEYHEKQQ